MRSDRGSVTLWVLGLSISILMLGGVALDLWRVLAVQRQAGALADAAAVAAATGIDEEHYRATGEILLDPERAGDLGLASIADQDVELVSSLVHVAPDGSEVSVEVVDEIVGGFIAYFGGDDGVLRVTVTATAEPRLIP